MPSKTRRRMLQLAAASAAGAALPNVFRLPAARAQSAASSGARRLGESLYLIESGVTNVLARSGPDGLVVVDGGTSADSEALLARLAELPSSARVDTLFNTHWHPEATGLNAHAGSAGATIIAQENTRLWLTAEITYPWDGRRFEPLPGIAQPNETFYDEGELASGTRYGYLRHAAHTDGDLYVHFPEENVLAVGGTVTPNEWPFIDWWTGGWIGGMVGNLELLLHLTDSETRVVPARGPVMSRRELEAQYAMYDTIFSRLAQMLNSGRGPAEAVAARPTQEFDANMGPPDAFVEQAFKSLWAYLSPDA